MESKKSTICLNMIVKNEAHVITETLEGVSKFISYYVINDTGSTDNTIQVIKDFFNKKGIPGEVISHEFRTCTCHMGIYKKYSFFHFGWNRSYALLHCHGKADYIWTIDADDVPMGGFSIPDVLTEDCYMLTIGNDVTYLRDHIFKNDPTLKWRYVGGIHEYPTIGSGMDQIKRGFITTGYIDSRRLGDRNKDSEKYAKDAKILEEVLIDEPTNERYMFYLAQSYFDHGMVQNDTANVRKAIECYQKRVAMGGWFEEVYYSYFRIAHGKQLLNDSWLDTEKAFLIAYEFCKKRAEPLYEIASHYNTIENYEKSYEYVKRASKIPFPKDHKLFVLKYLYDYNIPSLLSDVAFKSGKYTESYALNKQLLESGNVPTDQVEKHTKNMEISQQKLHDKQKKVCCFYFGNEVLSHGSPVIKIIEHAITNYAVIIIGNKVDTYAVNNVLYFSIINFKKFESKISIDYLVLVNSLNYFYDNIKIKCKKMILLQYDIYLMLHLNNEAKMALVNKSYLNSMLQNIHKIVCIYEPTFEKFMGTYKFERESVMFVNSDQISDYYLIFDDTKSHYQCENISENDTNGVIYIDPPYITHLISNVNIFPFARELVVEYGQGFVKQFPTHPESHYKLASLHTLIQNTATAMKILDDILKMSKIPRPYDDVVMVRKAELLFKYEKYEESYNLVNNVLNRNYLPESIRTVAEDVRDINIDIIKDIYLSYPKAKINVIKTKSDKKILFSITTCKRYDLFERTMNSFINTCLDLNLVDHWLCVDDNSSDVDRKKMAKQYPFFEFVWKNESQKGHYVSMNIIREKNIAYKCEYNLHMEDDFHFIQKRNYITDALKIMGSNIRIGQVLFNKNYAEIEPYKQRIVGGVLKYTDDGMRYVVHEYYDTKTEAYQQFLKRHEGQNTCGYWPHFSFRPSIVRVSMLRDIGCYYNTAHFEMQYALEYVSKHYVSAFMDTFSCIHIGKKTWEKTANSYTLNNTGQFNINDNIVSISIFTHDDSTHWTSFKDRSKDKLPYFIRSVPEQILELNPDVKKLFYGNNFNYNREIIQSIMHHINLFRENTSDYLMILHDRVTLVDKFAERFKNILNTIKLGSLFDLIILDNIHSGDLLLSPFNYGSELCLEQMNGYIISKQGILKILTYLDIYGIKQITYLQGSRIVNAYTLNTKLYAKTKCPAKTIIPSEITCEGYTFYSQLDSPGNDQGIYGEKSVHELKAICEETQCIAFNTSGCVKDVVTDELDFVSLKDSKPCDGIYVKNATSI